MITGLVVGLGLGLGLILASILFIIRSRKQRDQLASEEEIREHEQEAIELPSPTILIDMPEKKLSELPDSQESLRHELPQDREFPPELDGGGIHYRQGVTSAQLGIKSKLNSPGAP